MLLALAMVTPVDSTFTAPFVNVIDPSDGDEMVYVILFTLKPLILLAYFATSGLEAALSNCDDAYDLPLGLSALSLMVKSNGSVTLKETSSTLSNKSQEENVPSAIRIKSGSRNLIFINLIFRTYITERYKK
jgi:hypothetical protein